MLPVPASLRRLSLRARLVLLVSALLAGVALFLLAFFPFRMGALSRRGLERRATGMALVLANAVAPGLAFDDAANVGEQLKRLADVPDAVYADVRYGDGRALASWRPERIPAVKLEPGEQPVVRVEGDLLHVAAQVRTAGGTRGALRIGFSLEELHGEQRGSLLAVGAVSAGVLAFGIGIALLIGTVLVAPIRKLTDAARQIADGDLVSAELALGGKDEVARMAAQFHEGQDGHDRDEIHQLAGSCARMLGSLRDASTTLHESAQLLETSVSRLTAAAGEHSETIAKQATALRQAQVTAQGFKQAADEAAQQAGAVLTVAAQADELSRSGEESIEQSLSGLGQIRTRVEDIARGIVQQSERTLQIRGITDTVKDLADQSHVLALNAAIEAARAGQHGAGFGVVAKEIRALADQSIRGTRQVQELLAEIARTTRATVSITESGVHEIEGGLGRVKASGEKLRALSRIVVDSSSAAREIAAAVDKQTSGIGELSTAVNDLSEMMDETMRRVESTNGAVSVVKAVSEKVMKVAGRYRL